jgi:hypothetical protein
MTTTIGTDGRLCNQVFRNLAVSLVAEKYDLYVTYINNDLMEELGLQLFCGKNVFNNAIPINEENYFSIYNSEKLESNLIAINCYQTKEISNLLYKYLNSEIIKNNIISKNIFNSRYNNNNDLFIHMRLTDASKSIPSINYFLNTIKSIDFDNIYLSSDEPEHSMVKEILSYYPETKIINYDPVKTIHFGSTCNNVILSHGSFSAVIGYIAFFSKVHYAEYDFNKMWHGDMFSIDGWIQHPFY